MSLAKRKESQNLKSTVKVELSSDELENISGGCYFIGSNGRRYPVPHWN